jgi:hypothetical protein
MSMTQERATVILTHVIDKIASLSELVEVEGMAFDRHDPDFGVNALNEAVRDLVNLRTWVEVEGCA